LRYFKQVHKGPAAARNLGIKNANGKIILFIGDDTIATPTFLQEHHRWHQQYPGDKVAVLGFVTWSPEITITPLMRWLEQGGPQFKFWQIEDKVQVDTQDYFYTSNISLKRRFLLENNEFFDEEFPYASFEDLELGHRLKKKGLVLKYNKDAIGYHYHYTSLKDICQRMIKVGKSSQLVAEKIGLEQKYYSKSIFREILSKIKLIIYYLLAIIYEKRAIKENIFKYITEYYYLMGAKRVKQRIKCKNVDVYLKALKDKCGLEIGGPSSYFEEDNILPLYPYLKSLDGCNYPEKTIWQGIIKQGYNYRYNAKKSAGFQYILDSVNLASIEENKYDFVLASHALEHIANAIKALKEWIRVIKNNGYLLVIIPHKDGSFDHKRQITTLSHLISDYNQKVGEDDLSHLEEILKFHDLSLDKRAGDFTSFKARSQDNFNNRCLHHHVFDTDSVLNLFNYLNLQIYAVDLVRPYHIIVLAKKLSPEEVVDNSKFLSQDAEWRKISPFITDQRSS
jgi:GT2 family glycosyltransferase